MNHRESRSCCPQEELNAWAVFHRHRGFKRPLSINVRCTFTAVPANASSHLQTGTPSSPPPSLPELASTRGSALPRAKGWRLEQETQAARAQPPHSWHLPAEQPASPLAAIPGETLLPLGKPPSRTTWSRGRGRRPSPRPPGTQSQGTCFKSPCREMSFTAPAKAWMLGHHSGSTMHVGTIRWSPREQPCQTATLLQRSQHQRQDPVPLPLPGALCPAARGHQPLHISRRAVSRSR